MDAGGTLARLKRPLLYVMGPLYVVAGVTHFLVPEAFAQIVPPALPFPLALAYLSGVAEIALGLGVLFERTRTLAAWGLVAMLVAIFHRVKFGVSCGRRRRLRASLELSLARHG